MTVTMWEVRAAPGRLDDLVAHLLGWQPAGVQIYKGEDRVVVIGTAVPGPPADLMARAPHSWVFERVG
jgi:hypothetical protein